jgi:hypothetical protein
LHHGGGGSGIEGSNPALSARDKMSGVEFDYAKDQQTFNELENGLR